MQIVLMLNFPTWDEYSASIDVNVRWWTATDERFLCSTKICEDELRRPGPDPWSDRGGRGAEKGRMWILKIKRTGGKVGGARRDGWEAPV